MPITQLQHCLHCKQVRNHEVILEHNKHTNTVIKHMICDNCVKCVNCDTPPPDPKQALAQLNAAYFAVVGGNETNAFRHVTNLIACNKQLAIAMFEYLHAVHPELSKG